MSTAEIRIVELACQLVAKRHEMKKAWEDRHLPETKYTEKLILEQFPIEQALEAAVAAYQEGL